MIRLGAFLMALLTVASFAQQDPETVPVNTNEVVIAQGDASGDLAVVKDILEKSGITDRTAEQASVIEDGRVVSLDLSNRDVANDGISVLPSEISKLTGLKVLLCKSNVLTALPIELRHCINLTKIDFSSNKITEIPLEFGQLDKLVDIDFRYNRLESLPYTIGNLKELTVLRLWGNVLTALPGQITLLPVLRELYLKDNRLPVLPHDIVKMKSLTYIDIEGNKLCNLSGALDSWLKQKLKNYRQTQKCW
jgi:Leucine-rich repeat (LRR) protein